MFIFADTDRVAPMHGDIGYLSETLYKGKYFGQEGSHSNLLSRVSSSPRVEGFGSELEKVKSVSDNLRVGPKTFCENKESDMKKVTFCSLIDFRATKF